MSVTWGDFSIVEAELGCLRDLLFSKHAWVYALNMAGSEMMLSTNKELVTLLKSSEQDEIYTESYPLPNQIRINKTYQLKNVSNVNPDDWNNWKARFKILGNASPIPFNLTIYKGRKSYFLPRKFVKFLFYKMFCQQSCVPISLF